MFLEMHQGLLGQNSFFCRVVYVRAKLILHSIVLILTFPNSSRSPLYLRNNIPLFPWRVFELSTKLPYCIEDTWGLKRKKGNIEQQMKCYVVKKMVLTNAQPHLTTAIKSSTVLFSCKIGITSDMSSYSSFVSL